MANSLITAGLVSNAIKDVTPSKSDPNRNWQKPRIYCIGDGMWSVEFMGVGYYCKNLATAFIQAAAFDIYRGHYNA